MLYLLPQITKTWMSFPKGYTCIQPSEAYTFDPEYNSVQTSFKISFPIKIQVSQIGDFQMPTTRNQKSKARKSREAEKLSDSENIDTMFGGKHFEREDSEFGNSARWPKGSSFYALVDHNTNYYSNSGENEIRRFAGNSHSSGVIDSSSEINRLSGELNQRITQEMNGLLNSVSLQIQRAISLAINEQVLPDMLLSTARSEVVDGMSFLEIQLLMTTRRILITIVTLDFLLFVCLPISNVASLLFQPVDFPISCNSGYKRPLRY